MRLFIKNSSLLYLNRNRKRVQREVNFSFYLKQVATAAGNLFEVKTTLFALYLYGIEYSFGISLTKTLSYLIEYFILLIQKHSFCLVNKDM